VDAIVIKSMGISRHHCEIINTGSMVLFCIGNISDCLCFWCRYRRASFCVEELLLVNPHHYLYHLKFAEVSTSIIHCKEKNQKKDLGLLE